VVGFVVAGRSLRQHAFWLFLSGLTATFLFLGIDSAGNPLGVTGLTLLALAVVAIVLSVRTDYRVFLIYGALGLYGWVSTLIVETFGGSRVVAFALILLGAVIVAAGLAWQRWSRHRLEDHRPGGTRAPAA
jgi:FtsH-binding integral membrane protein